MGTVFDEIRIGNGPVLGKSWMGSIVEITERIDALAEVLESAKSRSLGGGAIVDREKALQLIAEIRAALPTELQEAQEVIAGATEVRQSAQAQATAAIAAAESRVQALATDHEVAQAAAAQARETLQQAEAQAEHKRAEVDAYVAAKLAAFEGTLAATLESVQHGRQKLASTQLPETVQLPEEVPAPA